MNRQRHWLRPALVALLIGLAIALLATASAGAAESGHVLAALLQWFRDPAQWQGAQGIPLRLAEHVGYVLWSMLMGMAVALPLGIGLGHYGRGGTLAINISNIGRAIPSFGLIILVFLLVGFGIVPILVALTALAIPPMVTNSYVGMRSVEPAIRQAARAMGMTAWQTLWRVELPIALPLVMAGIRTSAVQVVSTATLAAYVGLGGLGRYLIDGLATRELTQVVGGAIVVALLAIVTEAVLAWLQKRIVSAGLIR
ncbi:MAG TPA: ABC transporter permease [Salinisphaeraceae bacterium]|nr:ABC transporter permease [Salinisphaeraceae bacterium]